MENNTYHTQKIVLDGSWYDDLLNEINNNSNNAEILSDESKKVILDRNQRILDKLDKYKKLDKDNNIYYYFYLRELKDLFWILLENLSNK